MQLTLSAAALTWIKVLKLQRAKFHAKTPPSSGYSESLSVTTAKNSIPSLLDMLWIILPKLIPSLGYMIAVQNLHPKRQ